MGCSVGHDWLVVVLLRSPCCGVVTVSFARILQASGEGVSRPYSRLLLNP